MIEGMEKCQCRPFRVAGDSRILGQPSVDTEASIHLKIRPLPLQLKPMRQRCDEQIFSTFWVVFFKNKIHISHDSLQLLRDVTSQELPALRFHGTKFKSHWVRSSRVWCLREYLFLFMLESKLVPNCT